MIISDQPENAQKLEFSLEQLATIFGKNYQ